MNYLTSNSTTFNQLRRLPVGPQLQVELVSPVEPQVAKVSKNPFPQPISIQPGFYVLEKFIKNGAKACKGTTKPNKAEARTLIILNKPVNE